MDPQFSSLMISTPWAIKQPSCDIVIHTRRIAVYVNFKYVLLSRGVFTRRVAAGPFGYHPKTTKAIKEESTVVEHGY